MVEYSFHKRFTLVRFQLEAPISKHPKATVDRPRTFNPVWWGCNYLWDDQFQNELSISKKAIVKHQDTYRDGGTKTYRVTNFNEIGLKFIYQDFRLNSNAKGKFYTDYPGDEGSVEILKEFIVVEILNLNSGCSKEQHYNVSINDGVD